MFNVYVCDTDLESILSKYLMFTFVIQIWNAGSVLGSVIRIPLTSMATLLAGGGGVAAWKLVGLAQLVLLVLLPFGTPIRRNT